MTAHYDPAVVSTIVDWARHNGIDPGLAVTTAWGESELNPDAEGDYVNGVPTSHGIIQGNDIHGKPAGWWKGRDGIRRSLDFVKPRWTAELNKRPDAGERWRDDPVGFLTDWWADAQGADPIYVRQRAPVAVANGLPIYDDWVSRSEGTWRDRATGLLTPMQGGVGRRFGVVDSDAPNGHTGIDFGIGNGIAGAPVRAVRPGIVRYAGWYNRNGQPIDDGTGLGQMVAIEDDRGVLWRYGHNSELYVYPGQRARQGETIAGAGTTGHSEGVHSHLERLEGGRYTDPAIDLLDVVTPPAPPNPPPPPPPVPEPPVPPTPDQPVPPVPPKPRTADELIEELRAVLTAAQARGDSAEAQRDQLRTIVDNLGQRSRALEDALTVTADAMVADANAALQSEHTRSAAEVMRAENLQDVVAGRPPRHS